MIHLDVLDVLRDVAPGMASAGQVKGQILDRYPEVSHANILEALKQLRHIGLAEEVTGVGEGASQWRIK
jgi:uncharacterized protein (DUF433 family)